MRDIKFRAWYYVTTNNIDSLYRAELADCDSIIAKHKKIIESVNK